MRRSISIILFFIFPKLLFAQVVIKTTDINLNFRSSPIIENNIICVIPKGSIFSVDYSNQPDSDWIQINYNGNVGFVYNKYISDPISKNYGNNTSGPSVKYYINSQGEKVQSPTYYTSPPSGATAECRDGTYSFSHNRRGTCSGHGGVKRWL